MTVGAWITRWKSPRAIIAFKRASDGSGIVPVNPPIGRTSLPLS